MIDMTNPRRAGSVTASRATQEAEQRMRAAKVTQQFTAKPPLLDFSKVGQLAVRAGGTSFADLYAVKRDPAVAEARQRAQRLDQLPVAIQRLNLNLTLEALEVLALVYRSSRAAGGNAVPVSIGELGRAVGTSPDNVGAMLRNLEQRGLIRTVRTLGAAPRYLVRI